MRERERETERQTDRQRQRDRDRHRERDRQTDRDQSTPFAPLTFVFTYISNGPVAERFKRRTLAQNLTANILFGHGHPKFGTKTVKIFVGQVSQLQA